jgi:hypothetical protein
VPETPPSRCSAIAGACSSSATSSTATISESCRPAHKEGIASNILADRLKRLVELGLLTREDMRAGQRARDSLTEPAIELIPMFAQLGSLGTSPPAHEPRAARSRRAARTRWPRALAGVHGRASPLAPWLRIPSAITERSRAPERGPPRCCQLLVAARRSTMSKGADGRRPGCLTCDPCPASLTGNSMESG